ncbi:MAG: redoxin family protein [Bacteroidota bacterium]
MRFIMSLSIRALLPISAFALSSCSNLNAEKISSDFSNWINTLTTQKENSLEVAGGFTIRGTLKNKPNQLIYLQEMAPEGLVMIDSVVTSKNGSFSISANTQDFLFCALQVSPQQMVYLGVNNESDLNVNIDPSGIEFTYEVTGKGSDESRGLKELLELNKSYLIRINSIEKSASTINPNTDEGYEQMMKLSKDYNALMLERETKLFDFATARGASFLPYFIVQYNVINEPNFQWLELAVKAANKANPAAKYSKAISERMAKEGKLMVGAVAPDINLAQPNGENLAMSSLRGKIVLIDFWASWCGPCRKENPFNVALYNKYKDKGFEIYGVSLDQDPNRWAAAIEKDGLTWKHVSDLKGWGSSAGQLYGIRSIPATVLLDSNGKIIAKNLRGEELADKLREIFGQ